MPRRLIPLIILMTTLLTGCGGDLANPPLIYLVANGKLVDGFQSSYCWDQGFGTAICKDTVAPYFESSTPLDASAPIQFQLDTPLPDVVTLTISKEVLGEALLSETAPASESIKWSPPVAPGEYILSVDAKWKPGVVSYWFSVSLE